MGTILVVGSLNMDHVIRSPEIPLPGETVLGTSLSLVPGGKGANQAYAAGKLGAHTMMIGAVGDDSNGKELVSNLASVGVDTSGIAVLKDQPTGAAFITVNDKGENNIIVVPGANSKLTPSHILANEALFDKCDAVLLQIEIPMETILCAAKLAKQKGKMVILDPAPVPPSFPEELIKYVDILKPNEYELARLSNLPTDTMEHIRSASKKMMDLGVATLVVTLGANGIVFVDKDTFEHVPSQKVQVVDTTAAGDSFVAAFALHLTNGGSIKDAICFGNKVSAIVVTRPGAQTSIPSLSEIEHL